VTRLTEAGTVVLPFAQAVLTAAAGARHAVDELTGPAARAPRRGHGDAVRVRWTYPSCWPASTSAIRRSRSPLWEDNSSRVAVGVRDGTADLTFLGIGADAPHGLGLHIVADEPIVAAVSTDDKLAGTQCVTLAEIAERALISLPRGTGLRSSVESAYAAAGLRPRVAFEASDPRMLARLAARGLGLAFLPASVASAHSGSVRAITITDPPEYACVFGSEARADVVSSDIDVLLVHPPFPRESDPRRLELGPGWLVRGRGARGAGGRAAVRAGLCVTPGPPIPLRW
jgi:DNA-binding transcriptional LysR family regulator